MTTKKRPVKISSSVHCKHEIPNISNNKQKKLVGEEDVDFATLEKKIFDGLGLCNSPNQSLARTTLLKHAHKRDKSSTDKINVEEANKFTESRKAKHEITSPLNKIKVDCITSEVKRVHNEKDGKNASGNIYKTKNTFICNRNKKIIVEKANLSKKCLLITKGKMESVSKEKSVKRQNSDECRKEKTPARILVQSPEASKSITGMLTGGSAASTHKTHSVNSKQTTGGFKTSCNNRKSGINSTEKYKNNKPPKNSCEKKVKLSSVHKKDKKNTKNSSKVQQSSESEISDWEDVEGHGAYFNALLEKDEVAALNLLSGGNGGVQTNGASGVQIELEAPQLWGMTKNRNKKSEEYWIMEHLRHRANRRIRRNFINCHKVHLLLLLGHGQYVNRLLNSEELLGSALSIISNKDVYPPKRVNLSYLEKFAQWFTKKISLADEAIDESNSSVPLHEFLTYCFEKKQARSPKEYVLMFVLIGRALGMNVRLIMALKPLNWKPSPDLLLKPPSHADDEEGVVKEQQNKSSNCKEVSKRSSTGSVDSSSTSRVTALNNGSSTKRKTIVANHSDDSGSDFEEDVTKKKRTVKKDIHSKSIKESSAKSDSRGKRSLSIDESEHISKKKRSESYAEWAEVYVEEEEKWICVDVIRGKIHCATELASRAPAPVGYVTAFNPDQSVKDVTKRYVRTWLVFEPKLRCDSKWWASVLAPYAPPFSARGRAEDKEMEQSLRQQPLPKTISEYKNHPLYALQRHLLKFQALYPPNPDPLGFIRGEAVYPRECVHTLHSRDTWIKQAKSVIVGEEPYKVVKARPKWDRVQGRCITDLPLDVFGSWQTEDYQPPTAKDGRVPRNEYGNVDLFQLCMIPDGTVHLNATYDNINRVARKLQIDCAPAMVGFDFHQGGTHPVFDGYIVCQEYRDVLVDAWKEERELKRQRDEVKRLRRVLDNWKRLVQGLLVRQHVREAYGGNEEEEHECDTPGGDVGSDTKNLNIKSTKAKERKRKVKQADVDALSPGTSKEKLQLGIDLHSDTVAMAKKCFRDAIGSRGVVQKQENCEKDGLDKVVPKMEDLILDSDEEIPETEEEKKKNVQKVLAWNDLEMNSLDDLSEESDCETARENKKLSSHSKCTSIKNRGTTCYPSRDSSSDSDFSGFEFQSSTYKNMPKKLSVGRKKPFKSNKRSIPKSVSSTKSVSHVEADSTNDTTSRLSLRRSARRPAAASTSVVYAEGGDDSHLLLDDSDVEDKTYQPERLTGRSSSGAVAPYAEEDLYLSEDSD